MTRLLVALCLFIASPAFASTWKDGGGWSAAPVFPGNDGVWTVLPDTSSPHNGHVTTCTTSSCTRTGSLPAPVGGGSGRLSPSAGFGKGAIAAGALALGGRVLPWLTAGKALYDWFDAAGVRYGDDGIVEVRSEPTPSSELGSGSWRGNPPVPQTQLGYGTPLDACKAVGVWRSADFGQPGRFVGTSVYGITATQYGCRDQNGASLPNVSATAQCPFGSPGVNGVCPYTQAWADDVASLAPSRLANANISPTTLAGSLEEVLKAGGSIEDTGTHTVTGPASFPGETKTKTVTAPNGTSQVTTVTNNYNYNYSGDTITITTTSVVQNPDGSTEETTSDTPDPLCSQNPNSLACVKLGDVPTTEPAWETKTIVYQADSLGLPAACPAPWTGQLRGWTLSFSYQPACDVAPQVRLAILALTTLGALLMIITTVRT